MSDQRRRELAESGMVNASDATRILGCKLKQVYEMRRAGLLPWAKIGGRIVFPRKALIDYVADRIHDVDARSSRKAQAA